MSEGLCGSFRFQIKPKIKVGVLTLQRKRPWPSCPNPETGNQWSQDMKSEIEKMLMKTPFEVTFASENIQIVDDPSLRKAVGKKCSTNHILTSHPNLILNKNHIYHTNQITNFVNALRKENFALLTTFCHENVIS